MSALATDWLPAADWELSTIYKWGLVKQTPKVLALFFVVCTSAQ